MASRWTVEDIINNRIKSESDVLIAEFQKSVSHGSVIDKSARLIAEMRFLQKKIEGERHWRDYFEGQYKALKEDD